MVEEKEKQVPGKKESLHPFIISMVLAAGIALGYMISMNTQNKPTVFSEYSYDKIQDVLDYLEANYVDSIDRRDLEEKAIVELLADLDPHSFYIPAEETQGIEEDMQGNFEGIGVQFMIEEDTILIESPIQNGPSEKVGVEAGDKIIYINDSLVAGVGISNSDVMKLLKGPKGSEVEIKVLRTNQLLSFKITRDKIPIYSVDIAYLINKNTGYLKINRFSATTYEEFMESMKKLKSEGMENLILDLRGNPGGYLQAAVEIADEFLKDKKMVVYTEGEHQKKYEYYANRKGIFEEGDLIVLIDQNSASASEILAGAIQDWDRGKILGRRSFGKGLVQDQHAFPDNSALRLTIARYYTPSGRSIQKPYDDKEAYFNELDVRYEDGELLGTDSLASNQDTTKYFTKIEHREVYGGGGITPDIFVPIDTSYANYYVAYLRPYIVGFLHEYKTMNEEKFASYQVDNFIKGFRVDDSMLSAFYQYAKNEGYKGIISSSGVYTKGLKLLLKANLAKQLYYNDGFYKSFNEEDPLLKEALKNLD